MTITITLKTPAFVVEGPSSGTSVSIPTSSAIVDVPPLDLAVDYGMILSQQEFIPVLPVRKIREVALWAEELTFILEIGIVPTDFDIRSESLELVKDMYLTLSDLYSPIEVLSEETVREMNIASIATNVELMSYVRLSRMPDINEVANQVVEDLRLGATIVVGLDDVMGGTDIGLLRVSSYADPTYFAEDYVEDYRVPF